MRRGLCNLRQADPPPSILPRCLHPPSHLPHRAGIVRSIGSPTTYSTATASSPDATSWAPPESRHFRKIRTHPNLEPSDPSYGLSTPFSPSQAIRLPKSQRITAASLYKQWRVLLWDFDRLVKESDFSSGLPKWVDNPQYKNDVLLWSALFNFCQRRGGQDGALYVWQEIFRRKTLVHMQGAVAQSFWQGVAAAATEDESFAESVWAYAEFVHEGHVQSWPKLYTTFLVHCLETRQYPRALRWHVRLSPNFDPGRKEFFGILKTFILDTDADMQQCLQSIYATSTHRRLYDTIVPYLWSQGHATLARGWRHVLTRHDDVPASSMSGPFLQYFSGYFPRFDLGPEERSIVEGHSGVHGDPDKPITNLFHTMNRVHGQTFGVSEKGYNDGMGAKWFATRWIPIDQAVGMVHALGFQEIGPLSLQSIALRAEDCKEVLGRIDQLRRKGISVGSTNYVKLIERLATDDDFDTLRDLLESDLHPDVFEDDYNLFRKLLGRAASLGDWTQYRLVCLARVISTEGRVDETSNDFLQLCVESRRKTRMLRIMADMEARNVPLSASAWQSLLNLVSKESSPDSDAYSPLDADFHVALCRRIISMKFPVPTTVWQDLLTTYGEQGRLDELDGLALELLGRYTALQRSGQPAMRVHDSDLPASMQTTSGEGYQVIPPDLPLHHLHHPIQLIFNQPLQQSIIEWGFRNTLERRAPSDLSTLATKTGDAHIARGIKLLALLRDGGVRIHETHVRKVASSCIAKLHSPYMYSRRGWQQARLTAQQFRVRDFKYLCDEAWGSEFLPEERELLSTMHKRADYIVDRRIAKEKNIAKSRMRDGADSLCTP